MDGTEKITFAKNFCAGVGENFISAICLFNLCGWNKSDMYDVYLEGKPLFKKSVIRDGKLEERKLHPSEVPPIFWTNAEVIEITNTKTKDRRKIKRSEFESFLRLAESYFKKVCIPQRAQKLEVLMKQKKVNKKVLYNDFWVECSVLEIK